MSRGVIWMVWGDNERVRAALPRSQDSVAKFHPELEQRVLWMPARMDLRCKAQMFDLSPFDQTLYLDADTVVLGKLDAGFEKAHDHGVAITINANPWALRYAALRGHGDVVEYDTGVVFFSRQQQAAMVFDAWRGGNDLDSSSHFRAAEGICRMPVNDQCAFAAAVHATKFNPFILPVNWNFHPRWQKTIFGPVKVWHDYNAVSESILRWNETQTMPGAVVDCGQFQ